MQLRFVIQLRYDYQQTVYPVFGLICCRWKAINWLCEESGVVCRTYVLRCSAMKRRWCVQECFISWHKARAEKTHKGMPSRDFQMVPYRQLGPSLIYLLWLSGDIAFNWTRKPVKSLEHRGAQVQKWVQLCNMIPSACFCNYDTLGYSMTGASKNSSICKERDKYIWRHIKCIKKYLFISYSWWCIKYCLAFFLCIKFKIVITSLFLSVAFVLLYFITWFYLYFVKDIQKLLS